MRVLRISEPAPIRLVPALAGDGQRARHGLCYRIFIRAGQGIENPPLLLAGRRKFDGRIRLLQGAEVLEKFTGPKRARHLCTARKRFFDVFRPLIASALGLGLERLLGRCREIPEQHALFTGLPGCYRRRCPFFPLGNLLPHRSQDRLTRISVATTATRLLDLDCCV